MKVDQAQNAAQTAHPSDERDDLDVVKYFDGKLADVISNLSPEYKTLNEEQLEARVNPTSTDWKLRQVVTDLMKQARLTGEEHIPAVRIYEGTITRGGWTLTYLTNPNKIAFILRPMVEHTDMYNAIHRVALNKIFQMVKQCEIDPKYLPQILKIAETAGNRVHGPVVQRMQIQSKNMNIEMNARDLPPESVDQGQIQNRIEELQAKLIEAPKDVTPKDEG